MQLWALQTSGEMVDHPGGQDRHPGALDLQILSWKVRSGLERGISSRNSRLYGLAQISFSSYGSSWVSASLFPLEKSQRRWYTPAHVDSASQPLATLFPPQSRCLARLPPSVCSASRRILPPSSVLERPPASPARRSLTSRVYVSVAFAWTPTLRPFTL